MLSGSYCFAGLLNAARFFPSMHSCFLKYPLADLTTGHWHFEWETFFLIKLVSFWLASILFVPFYAWLFFVKFFDVNDE